MLGIKKIYLFILKAFGMLFLATSLVSLFIFMMQFLWRYVDDLIGKGLTLDILAQFFFYAGLTMVPMSLPIAVLLASLICFGNFGERLELLAMKAAGIPLVKIFRPLIVFVFLLAGVSFVFQDVVAPQATRQLKLLLLSMRQTSPELDIPEGIFYNDIPGYNLYVQEKDMETGVLRGVMIYINSGNFEDAQIILADSATMHLTAERKHLELTLYTGERFRNMQSQSGVTAYTNVPYMRETFMKEVDLVPFNADFDMADASAMNMGASALSMKDITHSIDSVNAITDSLGRYYYDESKRGIYNLGELTPIQQKVVETVIKKHSVDLDSVFDKKPLSTQLQVLNRAKQRAELYTNELDFKRMITSSNDEDVRYRLVQWHIRWTLSISCILFFFIGAPLGSIIRKGGLGMPVIISVGIFIFYYIIDFAGQKMVKAGEWNPWFGLWLSTYVLLAMAVFFTYKANKDSALFNIDRWRVGFRRALGLRNSRHLFNKEVIIYDPDYEACMESLSDIARRCKDYRNKARLWRAPNYFRLFFKYHPDVEVEEINEQMEATVAQLSNSRNHHVIGLLNDLPVIAVRAHTRPFGKLWMNTAAGIFLPTGIFFYLRMSRFRWRLNHDLRQIRRTCNHLQEVINREIISKKASK